MKYETRVLKAMVWSAVPAALLLTWAGCSKTETTEPVTVAVEEVGAPKLEGQPFIKVISTGTSGNFRLCDSNTLLVPSAPGPAVPYICQQSFCSSSFVTIKNGTSPTVFCFNTGAGTSYRIKAEGGPPGRQTLKFGFPAGYNECGLNPATCFNYDWNMGVWSVTTPLYGIWWYQLQTTCP